MPQHSQPPPRCPFLRQRFFIELPQVLAATHRQQLCSRIQLLLGLWDVNLLTRDQTHVPCIVRRVLKHRATGEVPLGVF